MNVADFITELYCKIDEGWNVLQIATALDVSASTVFRIKRRYAEAGLH
jgi:transposase